MPAGPSPTDAPRSGTQSVERAIAVLECFATSSRSLGLSEIARQVGLTPSTTHRLLRALVNARYVEQDSTSELYNLGVGAAVLGQRALEHSGYHLARPTLEALAASTGESASLGIRSGDEVVVMERATSHALLRFDHPAGAEIAMHASAMGKVLLAFSDRSIDSTVRGLGRLHRFTEHTVTDPDDLAAELDAVRTQGYAANVEERHIGVCGLAAPVRATSGAVFAAVGLQCPSVRLTDANRLELVPLVQAAALEVATLIMRP